jgi:hypothetical protein
LNLVIPLLHNIGTVKITVMKNLRTI